jgi:hypothetical protein
MWPAYCLVAKDISRVTVTEQSRTGSHLVQSLKLLYNTLNTVEVPSPPPRFNINSQGGEHIIRGAKECVMYEEARTHPITHKSA